MNNRVEYIPIESCPRQAQEPLPKDKNFMDLCYEFKRTLFWYWLAGTGLQLSIIWLIISIAKVVM